MKDDWWSRDQKCDWMMRFRKRGEKFEEQKTMCDVKDGYHGNKDGWQK